MGRLYNDKNKRIRTFANMFLALLLGYLMFHLCLSERSIPSYIHLSAQEQILDQKLARISDETNILNDKVARLRPDTLDHDLLAEQVVRMLGKASDNSVIILDNQS